MIAEKESLPIEPRKSPRAKTATLRDPGALADAGLIAPYEVVALASLSARYAIAVTPHVANLIDVEKSADGPIARQYLPSLQELKATPAEREDPIGDKAHMPVKGIVHRYPDRVLLKPLHACAVYCRFCFRREMVGPGGDALTTTELAAALDYIRTTQSIREVILTGGDPLMLAPRRLASLLGNLENIGHLRVLRIHTRIPVADPARITAEVLNTLGNVRKPLFIAIHANHPHEFTLDTTRSAIRALASAGAQLLGQSVLLQGINDDAQTLSELFWRMIELGIKPYYLHHPDLAPGTSHFRPDIDKGQTLMRALRGRMPGYALPTYVLDIPGGFGKVPIDPVFYDSKAGIVIDVAGNAHIYPPSP